MYLLPLVSDYFIWHYGSSVRQFLHIWLNFVWFTTHYFSIPLLLGSLFAPWKRMTEKAGKRSFEAYAEVFVVNIMSRVLGFVVRSFIVLTGLILLVLEIVGAGLFFAVWLLAPAVVVGCLLYGASLLFI